MIDNFTFEQRKEILEKIIKDQLPDLPLSEYAGEELKKVLLEEFAQYDYSLSEPRTIVSYRTGELVNPPRQESGGPYVSTERKLVNHILPFDIKEFEQAVKEKLVPLYISIWSYDYILFVDPSGRITALPQEIDPTTSNRSYTYRSILRNYFSKKPENKKSKAFFYQYISVGSGYINNILKKIGL